VPPCNYGVANCDVSAALAIGAIDGTTSRHPLLAAISKDGPGARLQAASVGLSAATASRFDSSDHLAPTWPSSIKSWLRN
jgi:hypothetical protein